MASITVGRRALRGVEAVFGGERRSRQPRATRPPLYTFTHPRKPRAA